MDARKAEQRKRRDLAGSCEPARSRSPHGAAAVPFKRIAERPGRINRSEGRRGRKVDA